jgi:hypothetical protein
MRIESSFFSASDAGSTAKTEVAPRSSKNAGNTVRILRVVVTPEMPQTNRKASIPLIVLCLLMGSLEALESRTLEHPNLSPAAGRARFNKSCRPVLFQPPDWRVPYWWEGSTVREGAAGVSLPPRQRKPVRSLGKSALPCRPCFPRRTRLFHVILQSNCHMRCAQRI